MDKFSDTNEKLPNDTFEKPIKTILFVDDEEPVRNIFKEALERFGYEVQLASDAEEGLQRFRENPADLIITDIFMPGKEGHEFITEVRKEFSGVKIFAITGKKSFNPDMELDLAKSLGAIKVFNKPCKISELITAIEEVSGHRKRHFSTQRIKLTETGRKFFEKFQNSTVLIGAGVIVLIVLVMAFSLGKGNGTNDGQYENLQVKLEELSARIDKIEGFAKSVSSAEVTAEALAQRDRHIESLESSLSERIGILAGELDEVKKKMIKTASTGALPASPHTTGGNAGLEFHTVQNGETLYRIGSRYGLKVDALRKLNNLSSDATIYPGQKLRVMRGPADSPAQ